jgi:ATP-binding cassette subfamily B multidrug efflux pump
VRTLFSFFERFLRYRGTLLLGFLCIPMAQLADVALTVVVGDAITRMQTAPDTEFMRGMLLLFALFVVVHAIFRFAQRWLLVVVSRRVEIQLKRDLFDKLTSLPFSFHNQSRSGDVVSRLTSDVENIRMFLGPGLMYTAGAMVVVPITIVLLFSLNPALALTMTLPMVLMGTAMKLLTPRLHRHSLAVQESLADISHRAQENFSGIRIVKGYAREDQQAALFERTSRENMVNQVELGRARSVMNAAIHGANDLTFVSILIIGGLALIDRRLVDGDLFKFIDLTFKVFWPLIALGWIAGMYPRAVASAQRIMELLGRESDIEEPQQPRELERVDGRIDLEGVHFTYPEAATPALSGIDLAVPSGSTLAVVGPTGCGKSTLLNLLGRLHEPEGTIRLDGVPIRELSLSTLRAAFGYVPQDSFLFSESYEANIRFGADRALSDAEVEALIERACMTEEVAAFPDGVDQVIGERGVSLSGGQRQRTCIARALARNPRVLVLDDCLSAVDTETEKELVSNLRDVGEGRTVILAAHQLSTVRSAEQVLVLTVEGTPADLGTHDQLIERPGWYRDTWRQQQRLEELSGL